MASQFLACKRENCNMKQERVGMQGFLLSCYLEKHGRFSHNNYQIECSDNESNILIWRVESVVQVIGKA